MSILLGRMGGEDSDLLIRMSMCNISDQFSSCTIVQLLLSIKSDCCYSTRCPAMSWDAHPHARSSHQPPPWQITAMLTIRFQVSEQHRDRFLILGFYAGTRIRAVKMLLAARAQSSGHRNLVPQNPHFFQLYLDGELLSDAYALTRDHHNSTMTVFP